MLCTVMYCGFIISTHTPLTRRDSEAPMLASAPVNFYSHASYEARRIRRTGATAYRDFYSHASYEARLLKEGIAMPRFNFYSHASYEARLRIVRSPTTPAGFLLTRLLRGATRKETYGRENQKFLLTRLLRGATILLQAIMQCV